ncbi:MAG: D-aminoacyl-tRNA deacylase, partial [Acidobacteriota bacterium]|nr:D-aminoacyl-tRNA deacylase [Acidobacteriota bacterium]
IGRGLLLYLAVKDGDGPADTDYLVDKVLGLRIFEDDNGKMNLSLKEVGGALLIVSQFTLYGDCRKGRRPSFSMAAPPEPANRLYQSFVERCRRQRIGVQTGVFRETMRIRSTNDGPVTLLLDSSKSF